MINNSCHGRPTRAFTIAFTVQIDYIVRGAHSKLLHHHFLYTKSLAVIVSCHKLIGYSIKIIQLEIPLGTLVESSSLGTSISLHTNWPYLFLLSI